MADLSKLPPRPWSYLVTAKLGQHEGAGHVYIVDANGRKIACVWGTPDEKIAFTELALTAANEGAPQ